MAKVTVVLTATLDNGTERMAPGRTLSMEEGEARQLASLGMARIEPEAAPAKGEKKGKKPKAKKDKDLPEQAGEPVFPPPGDGGNDTPPDDGGDAPPPDGDADDDETDDDLP